MFINIPSTANLTQGGKSQENPSSERSVAAVLGVLPQANVAEVRTKLQQYKNDINRVIIDMMPQETAVFGGGVTKTSESSVTTSQTRLVQPQLNSEPMEIEPYDNQMANNAGVDGILASSAMFNQISQNSGDANGTSPYNHSGGRNARISSRP